MKILLLLLFLGWTFFSVVGNNYGVKVIRRNNLYRKKWHIYKMGFSKKYLKKVLKETDDLDIKTSLLKAIFYLKISNRILWIFLLVFLSVVIHNNWERF